MSDDGSLGWLTYPASALTIYEGAPKVWTFMIVAETKRNAARCMMAVLASAGVDVPSLVREEEDDADR